MSSNYQKYPTMASRQTYLRQFQVLRKQCLRLQNFHVSPQILDAMKSKLQSGQLIERVGSVIKFDKQLYLRRTQGHNITQLKHILIFIKCKSNQEQNTKRLITAICISQDRISCQQTSKLITRVIQNISSC
ncbi:unnamed protein product [Paramecium octaurelia]|uniref:Uncharacterized protein n=1 Tax=Paramecium octaurelia TaxID=43137 RepID=A0A8S1YF77_PAROT|nr:unnamed protein product [Paramecium octaurelia]